MIGVDTNLLVRLFVNDDKKQAEFAKQLIVENTVFIAKTVLLETEWVLRYTYRLPPVTIFESFKKLLGLSQVIVEDIVNISRALDWYSHHLDFADALHLASCQKTEKFITFDRKLIKKAKKCHIEILVSD